MGTRLGVYAICYPAVAGPSKQYVISAYNDDLVFMRIDAKYEGISRFW